MRIMPPARLAPSRPASPCTRLTVACRRPPAARHPPQAHLGTKNCTASMERYVYRRRSDGIFVFNLGKTWEKLQLAARIIVAIENPQDIVAISARPYGQRAVLKFANYTGSRSTVGRHTPGAPTRRPPSHACLQLLCCVVSVPLASLAWWRCNLERGKQRMPDAAAGGGAMCGWQPGAWRRQRQRRHTGGCRWEESPQSSIARSAWAGELGLLAVGWMMQRQLASMCIGLPAAAGAWQLAGGSCRRQF